MRLQNEIEQKVKADFNPLYWDLKNESNMHAGPAEESHFKLTLVSDRFCDLSRVKRHQLVYKTLAEVMTQIHALALHTYTQAEWAERQAVPDSPLCVGGH